MNHATRPQPSLVICPHCRGAGVIKNADGGIGCQQCAGAGIWLNYGNDTVLAFDFPAFSGNTGLPGWKEPVSLLALLGSLSLGALSVGLILRDNPSLSALAWQRGPLNALLAASGMGAIVSLTWRQSLRSTAYTLDDLATQLEKPHSQRYGLNRYVGTVFDTLLNQVTKTAQEWGYAEASEEILFLALLQLPRIRNFLVRLECPPGELENNLKQTFAKQAGIVRSVSFGADVRSRFYAGFLEAWHRNFPLWNVEDVFISYAQEGDRFSHLFAQAGVSYNQLASVARWYADEDREQQSWKFWREQTKGRPSGFMNRAWTALPTPVLDSYGSDLSAHVAAGHGVHLVGRDQEVRQLLAVLSRTKKNNALLIGEPGTGKETIVEHLAQLIWHQTTPAQLYDKRVIMLDAAAVLASNDPVSLTNDLVEEAEQAGNVVIVIPDLQMLVGNERSSQDAANILASALNRGALQVIASTTNLDFHRYVEANPRLTALFEPVAIGELSVEQTIEVLQYEVATIENEQDVVITHPAMVKAAELAQRYYPDRMLPESAMNLLDEAAAQRKLEGKHLVQESYIVEVVENKTGIKISNANEQESDSLINLETSLRKRIVGQELALVSVASAVRRSRAGLNQGTKPSSSFLFVGPTGVGKTETARALADIYFSNEQALIRLDMSEYQDPQSVYRLIGAPAKQSDSFTEGGVLTQAVRERAFRLILIDEIEKAHPDVLNLFLQLLDAGRLTENTGRTVSFRECIVIATSNASNQQITQLMQQGLSIDQLNSQVLTILENHFRPELLNRFDAIVPFSPLGAREAKQIINLLVHEVQLKSEARSVILDVTPEAVDILAAQGLNPLYGARPLRRIVQEKVEGTLADYLLKNGAAAQGTTLQITADMVQ